MDFTNDNRKLFTTKIFNGETVNYTVFYLLGLLAVIAVKQATKIIFELSASYASLIAFIVVSIIFFFVEKRFVFNHNSLSSSIKQIIGFIFRDAVDIGIFKILSILFTKIIAINSASIWCLAAVVIFVFNYYFDRLITFDCYYNAVDNKKGRIYKTFFHNRFVIVSMLGAIASIAFCFLIFNMFPFGTRTVLRMDLYHQYGPLFTELYDRIIGGKSLFYSWTSGGGSGFLGNFFNYLSSPLTLIMFLFDRKAMPYAITTIVVVKAVLSAGAFTYYLKASLKSHSYVSSAFGIFYAFCGYFLAYYWNVMWLDALILFPFVLLGIEKIINQKKPVLYIASLSLLFFSSYYMAYMVCIFSVIYFFVYFFIHYNTSSKISNTGKKYIDNRFLSSALSFAASSVLVGLLMAAVLIPVYLTLKSCSATSDTMPTSVETYFDFLDLLGNHLAGIDTTIRSSGDSVLPNISCGILSVILIPLYLLNNKIALREKLANVLLLFFFVLSFNCNIANFVWHAFHFPNDLPYRFSYMYSFVILVLAFRVLMNFKDITKKEICASGLAVTAFILVEQKLPNQYINKTAIIVSLLLVAAWTFILLLIKNIKFRNSIIGLLLLSVTVCEVMVSDTTSYEFTQEYPNYVESYDAYEDVINKLENKDKSMHRTELCYLNTRMDNCLYNYSGESIFSSMAYENLSKLQYSLGMFGNRVNSFTYNQQTPIYNMMFGIKYLIDSKTGENVAPSNDYYKELFKSSDKYATVYQNKFALPIGYCVNNNVLKWDTTEGNPFAVQEDFFDKATGLKEVFVPVKYESTFGDNCTVDGEVTDNGTFTFSKDNEDDYGTIEVTFKCTTDSNVYLYVSSDNVENITVDDAKTSIHQSVDEPYILDIGSHSIGDTVTVSIDTSTVKNSDSSFSIYAYGIDNQTLQKGYNILNKNKFDITEYSDTKVKGTVTCSKDTLLYTSIPFDNSWNITVDGKKVKPENVGNGLIGLKLSKGKHNINFKYTPSGMYIGWAISGATVLGLTSYYFLQKRKKRVTSEKIV